MGCGGSKDATSRGGANNKAGEKLAKTAVNSTAESLTDYSTFFPKDKTTSLLSKFLTKEIWEEYKD